DAGAKMSKSNASEQSVVKLVDSDDVIAEKFRKAKSDADLLPATVEELADRPEASNLLTIFSALSDRAPQHVLDDYAGKGFGAFKPALADLAVATLAPIRNKMVRLLDDKAAIAAILNQGAEKARALAAPTLKAAQDAMGLLT
ncbi:MAG: tryptophan--tRNA ligase, partial [Pseudomonadota bacterium]|nr:tryptophan--tRNA ligase [Pseudomonadota bacterium]